LTGVSCTKAPGTDKLQLPYCLSWRQPGANEFCEAPTEANGSDGLPHTADDVISTDAFPGSPSKCRCDDNFFIDVTVTPPPTGSGYKCAVAAITGCTTVRYEVQVSGSPSGSDTSVTVEGTNPLTDSAFGDITKMHAVDTDCAGSAVSGKCEAVTGTTCGQVGDGVDIANGAGVGSLDTDPGAGTFPAAVPYTCRFDGTICSAPGDHTNQITGKLKGHPSNQTSTFPTNPNDSNNGPSQGRVTIHVNDITGTGANLCPTQ
jgi:hypothetical protein